MKDVNSWSRRQVISLFTAMGLGGCSDLSSESNAPASSGDSSSETRSRSTSVDETTETENRNNTCFETSTPTVVRNAECYQFGTWYEPGSSDITNWRITALGTELISYFKLDGSGKRYEVPNEEKIAILTTEVHNISSSVDTWEPENRFVLLSQDGDVAEPQGGYDHPEFSESIDIDELQRIKHAEQYLAQGGPVSSGEIRRFWWLIPLSRNFYRDNFAVGFSPSRDSNIITALWGH